MRVILVATDGSEPSQHAVEMAASIAEKFDAQLVIVSSLQFHELTPDEISLAENEFRDQLREYMTLTEPEITLAGDMTVGRQLSRQASLSRAIHKLLGERLLKSAETCAKSQGAKRVKSVLVEGEPATAIIETAKSEDASLIVLGRRGRGRTASMLLGSVSARVVELSDGAVMTVA